MTYDVFAFPSGLVGAGLASLRAAIAVFLVTAGVAHPFGLAWLSPVLYLIAAAVLIGFQTRGAAGLVAALALGLAMRQSWTTPVIAHALDAVAVTLLGPGALSVDAYRFGRRTVHLPR